MKQRHHLMVTEWVRVMQRRFVTVEAESLGEAITEYRDGAPPADSRAWVQTQELQDDQVGEAPFHTIEVRFEGLTAGLNAVIPAPVPPGRLSVLVGVEISDADNVHTLGARIAAAVPQAPDAEVVSYAAAEGEAAFKALCELFMTDEDREDLGPPGPITAHFTVMLLWQE